MEIIEIVVGVSDIDEVSRMREAINKANHYTTVTKS